jgi:hypothetical protein
LRPINVTVSKMELDSLKQFYEQVPLFIRAKVGKPSQPIDQLAESKLRGKSSAFSFAAIVEEVVKGNNIKNKSLRISYQWQVTDPPIATPAEGQEWIFAIGHIAGDEATPYGTRCGNLGFPITQVKVYAAFEKIRKQAQRRGIVSSAVEAEKIAIEFFKRKINADGPQRLGKPTITKDFGQWCIRWADGIWIIVSERTGEAYQADSGSD